MSELKRAAIVYKDDGSNKACEVSFSEGREPEGRGDKDYCEKVLRDFKSRMR